MKIPQEGLETYLKNNSLAEIGKIFKKDGEYIGTLYKDNNDKSEEWRIISLANGTDISFSNREEVISYFETNNLFLIPLNFLNQNYQIKSE